MAARNRTYKLSDECIQKIDDIACMTNALVNIVMEKMIMAYSPDQKDIRFYPKK